VGVRPEDLVPVSETDAVLVGEVTIAEQLGGETYVYVTLPDGQSATVEIKGQARVAPGDRLHLAFEDGKFHIFGSDEKVIRRT